MKLRALLCLGTFLAIPSFAFAAACPGTTWTKPFPGSNSVTGNTCNGTNSISSMCTGGVDSPGNDDVYTFVGDGSSVSLTVTPTSANPPTTDWDVAVQVMTGACGTGTCLSGTGGADANGNNGAETVSFTAANGTTYFVVVYSGQLAGNGNCGAYGITGQLPVTLEKFSVD
jgi:hypothetical protein